MQKSLSNFQRLINEQIALANNSSYGTIFRGTADAITIKILEFDHREQFLEHATNVNLHAELTSDFTSGKLYSYSEGRNRVRISLIETPLISSQAIVDTLFDIVLAIVEKHYIKHVQNADITMRLVEIRKEITQEVIL